MIMFKLEVKKTIRLEQNRYNNIWEINIDGYIDILQKQFYKSDDTLVTMYIMRK